MFEAIGRVDRASLRTLANTFIGMGNDTSALLCLDHVFSSFPKLRNLPLAELQTLLSLYLDYIRLLNKLRRDESLAQGSNRQKLFGFQVLGKNRYLVPQFSILHGQFTKKSGSSRKNADGYTCGYDELRLGIVELVSSRISDRTKIQNNTCRDVQGFSPCLRMLIQKRCNPQKEKGSCILQHIQPEELTIDWYHTRLHLILLQFRILDLARYDGLDVKKYVLAHPVRNVCIYSSNTKLLAWNTVLGASSTFSGARIDRES